MESLSIPAVIALAIVLLIITIANFYSDYFKS